MILLRKLLILNILCYAVLITQAQRTYKPNSVLSSGNWYRISLTRQGIYKMDLGFMNSLGISGSIPSAQLRIFGKTGFMLAESNSEKPVDDLEEVAISVIDGGDGIINGNDYVLFYSNGPHQWIKDSINRRFSHRKNLYSDKVYYYVTVGGSGLRIPAQTSNFQPGISVTSFNERYFHEVDTANFLSSGKEWYGEEFSSTPGRSLTSTFVLPLSDLVSQQATLVTDVAARSVNATSRFNVSVNNQLVQQLNVNPITTSLYDRFAQQSQKTDVFNLNQGNATLSLTYIPGGFNSQGWLNWFEFFPRRNLKMPADKQLSFRDWNSTGSSSVEFIISNTEASTEVWEITDALHPVKMKTVFAADQTRFNNDAQVLKEYISFSSYYTPSIDKKISNQNLHNTTEKDFIIITYPDFLQQAQRLAVFHEQMHQLRTGVLTTEQVFNEFSGGIPDPSAIRDLVKMYYDKYRSTWKEKGKYLLLFGKGSFDYKNKLLNNTNFVPAYESNNSLDPLSTYTSDDYFGFLDDNEDINSGLILNELDIGIGRIPSKTIDEAKNFVDKVLNYHEAAALGPWRNNLNFIADDEDQNLHLQDAEILTNTVTTTAPVFNHQKIYLDAFRQENGSSGGRYPQANTLINSNIFNGTLIWNYNGHGGPQKLAEEVVIDQQIVNSWNNPYRLPLFITATCDFAPYDHPTQNSLGENLLVRPKTGAIALMTTTRLVFSYSNRIINNNYLKFALEPDSSGNYKTLGEAIMATKNYTYQTSGDIINNRKFALLGDPAMTLAFPANKMRITKLNGKDISVVADTISAAELITMEGEITDYNNKILDQFHGTAYLTVFDKIQSITTLANDPTSLPVSFPDQQNSLFRGKATVQNGKYVFKFRVPKDINYQFGNGKLSLYGDNGNTDGNGFTKNIIIGGISNVTSTDKEGPEIKAYLNDERFVNGSISNSNPVLILKLSDSSGIHTGGTGVDHDIVATLDNDNRKYYILNNFYETELDNYQKGSLRFQLPELEPGNHSLKIKAWDVMNNSNETILDFTVVNSNELKIDHVLNYPNPFTTNTNFWFEHNQPGTELRVKIEIYTVSGRLIKTIARTIISTGNRSNEIAWDGRDEYGDKIAKGVYIYRLKVLTINGKSAEKWERLVILGK